VIFQYTYDGLLEHETERLEAFLADTSDRFLTFDGEIEGFMETVYRDLSIESFYPGELRDGREEVCRYNLTTSRVLIKLLREGMRLYKDDPYQDRSITDSAPASSFKVSEEEMELFREVSVRLKKLIYYKGLGVRESRESVGEGVPRWIMLLGSHFS
jgi:hypothetical protein